MKSARPFALALVTAPNLRCARQLAQAVLKARAAACVNLVPRVESLYWWQGKVECADEVLLVFKTRRSRLKALETLILGRHPYDTPEFVVLPLAAGNERYLAWLGNETGNVTHKTRDGRPEGEGRGARRKG